MGDRTYWVYIMTNRSGTLSIGMTSDLPRRVFQHRTGAMGSFTSRYRIDTLIHAEAFGEVLDAIAREKQLKGWTRARKVALVSEHNPEWRDLGLEWFGKALDES